MLTIKKTFPNGIEVSTTGETAQACMEELGTTFEYMGDCCGQCKSKNVGTNYRHVECDGKTPGIKKGSYDYYEMKCFDCGASLSLGVRQDTKSLFPKRKDANGSFDKEHRGWKKFNERKDEE